MPNHSRAVGLERAKVARETSLGDLGADELDFVELVMELEEHFDVSIPDEAAERLMGTSDWQRGMKNVTMVKLAALIDDCKRSPQGNAQPPQSPPHQ
jgi:acyl carrier protein